MVFFDCREEGTASCLETILRLTNLEAFTIFLVVKEPRGTYKFMDARFRNLGTETLQHFITRFHKQLAV